LILQYQIIITPTATEHIVLPAFLESKLKMRLLMYWATLAVFIIAAVVSVVLALVVLLDPSLKDSGIVTLKVRGRITLRYED
jgi:hypothetical protein